MKPYARISPELKILEVNADFVKVVRPKTLSVGSEILCMFDIEDRDEIKNSFDECKSVRKNTVISKKKILVVPESGFPVNINYDVELIWIDGCFGAWFWVVGDRFRLELAELHDFFNKAPIALHWLSDDGRVLWANDRELEVLEYSREEYIGEQIMKFCPDSEEKVLAIFKSLGTGDTIRDVPVRFRTKSGTTKDLLIDSNVNYKPNGEFNHTRCFIRDDTGRKVREARAQESRLSEKRVAREKECFTSKIMHEIKTPIHIMNMIMETCHGSSSDSDLVEQIRILSRLVNNITVAMQFDGGVDPPYQSEVVDIERFFGKYRNMAEVTTKTGLIVTDAVKLSTVTHEIVSYCKGLSLDGRVYLNVLNLSKGSDKFAIEISCNGICDEATIQRHFHRYWLDLGSHDLKSDLPGLNLGLYIAFNNVQLLGSDLLVQARRNETVFKFEVVSTTTPAPKTKEDTGVTSVVPDGLGLADTKVKHILLVEDNTISQKICKRLLEKIGHTCVVADNGEIAVNMVITPPCVIHDLVLMDIRMPVMDGLEATRQIKEYLRRVGSNIHIIALTAEENVDLRKEEFDVGFSHVLKKPTSLKSIENAIKRFT